MPACRRVPDCVLMCAGMSGRVIEFDDAVVLVNGSLGLRRVLCY
jgi:hypothetical protein